MKEGARKFLKFIKEFYLNTGIDEKKAHEYAVSKMAELVFETSGEALRRVYISNQPVRSIKDLERLCRLYQKEIEDEPKRRERIRKEMEKYQS